MDILIGNIDDLLMDMVIKWINRVSVPAVCLQCACSHFIYTSRCSFKAASNTTKLMWNCFQVISMCIQIGNIDDELMNKVLKWIIRMSLTLQCVCSHFIYTSRCSFRAASSITNMAVCLQALDFHLQGWFKEASSTRICIHHWQCDLVIPKSS